MQDCMALHASRKYHSNYREVGYHERFYNLMKPLGLTRYIEKLRVDIREHAKIVNESVSGLEPIRGRRI